jgi:outer membrane lipoprotein
LRFYNFLLKEEGPRQQRAFVPKGDSWLSEKSSRPGECASSTPITVIGVVTGSTTKPLDDIEYNYPVVDIKHLIDWTTVASPPSEGGAAAFYGPYYSPFGYGYWGGPYGYYPYFGRPYPFYIQPRPPSPRPPSPQHLPPQFRK